MKQLVISPAIECERADILQTFSVYFVVVVVLNSEVLPGNHVIAAFD